MKQVLHIINGEYYSGAERVQDLLALKLLDFGYQAKIACLKPGRFPEKCLSRQENIYSFPMHSRFDAKPIIRLKDFIRQNKICLIHTHTPRAVILGRTLSAITHRPLIHHMHSPTIRCTENKLRNMLNASAERCFITGARRIIAVSSALRTYLRHMGVAGQKIRVIPNGVPGYGQWENRMPPESPWRIAMVSLFRPRKGLDILLEALALLKSEGIDFKFFGIGPFEKRGYEAKIMSIVDQLHLWPHIQWLGFREDIGTLLKEMDLMVLPSLSGEGLPMVLLEAMAAGLPVAASRSEGITEVIENGVTGLLVEPGNADDLAQALKAAIEGVHDWSALRSQAYQHYLQHYSDVQMVKAVARIYDEVLKNG